jgi:hypothetical protein
MLLLAKKLGWFLFGNVAVYTYSAEMALLSPLGWEIMIGIVDQSKAIYSNSGSSVSFVSILRYGYFYTHTIYLFGIGGIIRSAEEAYINHQAFPQQHRAR